MGFRIVRLFGAICVLSATVAWAQSTTTTGSVSGRVVDGATQGPLPGALVGVEGLTLTTMTARDGEFRLPGLPTGGYTLLISYIGRKDARVPVTIRTGETVTLVAKLELDTTYKEAVTVTGLAQDAQERALNQQKTAPNITNIVSADQIGHFPDPNAAEVTQRIPGVSIQRDQGEGRYVIVRGTEPRLNSMLINGERIPAPEADVRQVALDVIPADLLQAVEVSKTLTPDMDGDAIGGAVNLVTKQAPEKLTVFGAVAGGFNRSLGNGSANDQHNASATIGRRLANNTVGFVVGASTNATRRGNQDFEPVYTAGNLTDLDLRNYVVIRRRHGVTGSVDFRPTPNALYTVRGMYNYFIDDHEQRQQFRNRIANRRIERVLRDRTHVEKIWNVSFSGHQNLGRTTMEYHLQGARSSQFDPGTITTTFRQSNVNFAPNVTATSIDPDNVQANPLNENIGASAFNGQVRAINTNSDRDIVGGFDVRTLLSADSGRTAFVKFGVKYRDKAKVRTRDEVTLTSATAIPYSTVVDAGGAAHSILSGRYPFGSFINLSSASALSSTFAMTSTINHARDAEDSTTGERVSAAYAMAELYLGQKLLVLPGIRVEHLSADYVASEVLLSPAGAWLATNPISGASSNTQVLPGFLVKYAATRNTNLRAAVTRTMARPNYINQIPNRQLDDQANTLSLGNPALRPTLSWNGDLMLEHYLKPIGLISAGLFYKRLNDYIYSFTTTQTINNEQFTVNQPQNGESATVHGVELAAQSQLSFLPSPLNGVGVYLNYTFTDSSAVFPGRTGEKATLPGQSRHVGNLSLSYDKSGFSGRVAVNFHGSYIDAVAASTGLDRFYDTHKQVDLSLSQRVTRTIRVYFNALNLTDAPLRYFQGTPDRPLQEEHYRWWADFGVKVSWSAR